MKLQLSRWISLTALFLLTFTGYSQIIIFDKIYNVENGDSTLRNDFITEVCEAARYPLDPLPGKPFLLEQLILKAAVVTFKGEKTPQKTHMWYKKFGTQCHCHADDKFPKGNLLKQVVLSNYRDFSNIIGPKNRLSLDLTIVDPVDSLNIFEFIEQRASSIETRYNNDRTRFQKDKDWRNIMFFYFLFSEYKINYDAQLKE